jgi:hypothetical protein
VIEAAMHRNERADAHTTTGHALEGGGSEQSGRPRLPAPANGLFDFRDVRSFAAAYIDTFYRDRPPTNDEKQVLRFLVRRLRDTPPLPAMLEVGCGPTVHHTFPFLPYVRTIHMADYLPENLEEVGKWTAEAPLACAWDQYAALVLDLEDKPQGAADVSALQQRARSTIGELLRCDLTQHPILGTEASYPLVSAFYCTEEVGISIARWQEVMANLAAAVAPGGRLLLSCLADTDFYLVGGTQYPCARISKRDVLHILPQLGFDTDDTTVVSMPIEGQADEGVVGVVLVDATKRR